LIEMNMASDIRVRTDRRYRALYNDLRNFVVKEMHEVLFLCACLGFREGERKPLGHDKDDRFWSSTITPEEYASYYAMIIEHSDMNFASISDDKVVLSTIEEYANAGMGILLREVLNEYTHKRGQELRLDLTVSKELPKVILAYVFQNVTQ